MSKKTPWFSGDVQPAHKGVYERRMETSFSYWNGLYWGWSRSTPDMAITEKSMSCWQNKPWRGLTKEQKQ